MKKIIYLVIGAVTAILSLVSCDKEDEQNVGIIGTNWNYTKPYFEFEYATDTIRIDMSGKTMKLAVKDLKQMFLEMAASKMQDYFEGIEFYSADSLLIKAKTGAEVPLQIQAGYLKNDKYIEVKLNQKDMSALMGDKAGLIPAISFRYFLEGQRMTIYFDEVYIQSIFENVQLQAMLLPMIGQALNPQFDQMPEQAQQAMLGEIKQQISTVLNGIQTLKIGFVLTR